MCLYKWSMIFVACIFVAPTANAASSCSYEAPVMRAGAEFSRIHDAAQTDCSLIDSAITKLQEVNQRAADWARHCGGYLQPPKKTLDQMRAELLATCKKHEQGARQSAIRLMSQGQPSTSCSTITDKDHPSGGPCKQADGKLNVARTLKKTTPAAARDHYKEVAEMFRRIGDFAKAVETLAEGGLPIDSPPSDSDPARFPINIGNKATCQTTIQPMISLEAEANNLLAQEPPFKGEETVRLGECAQRIAKLYNARLIDGPAAGVGVTAFAGQALNHNARACLELKVEFLKKACKCEQKGEFFSTDPAVQDRAMAAYKAVQDLDKRAREAGIVHPAIRSMVEKAADVRDCFNLNTLTMLQNTQKALEQILNVDSAPTAPVEHPKASTAAPTEPVRVAQTCSRQVYAETAWCASSKAPRSSQAGCIESPMQTSDANQRTGMKTFSVGLNLACSAPAYMAVIESVRADGTCTRKVVRLSASSASSATIESSDAPRVLDAIALTVVPGENKSVSDIAACYTRRHNGNPCVCAP